LLLCRKNMSQLFISLQYRHDVINWWSRQKVYPVAYTAAVRSCLYLRNWAGCSSMTQKSARFGTLNNKGQFYNTKLKVCCAVKPCRWQTSLCHISTGFTDSTAWNFTFITARNPPLMLSVQHWGFQEVEAPRFQDNRHMKVVRLSALRTGRLHQEIPGTHFC
jgi:hypothetical protein